MSADKKVTIWHNPRCSKSREALKLLEQNDADVEIFKYLDEEITKEDIKKLLKMIGVKPREIMRTKEAVYKELSLKDVEDDEKLIEAMVEHHKLIERPIVIKGNKAIIGRPPVRVLELV